jgi:hypothetical protein
LTITAKGRVLGETFAVQRNRKPKLPSRMTLRLSKAGAKALKRAGHLQVRIGIVANQAGDRSAASFLVTL